MNKLIEGEKLRKRLENLSREELIELAINQKLKVDSIDNKVSRLNIPTACRARELTIAADKKEELRVGSECNMWQPASRFIISADCRLFNITHTFVYLL